MVVSFLVICDDGEYRVDEDCLPCDYGWWRMGIEMENCTACDEGTTTEEPGAISADSCICKDEIWFESNNNVNIIETA